MACLHLMREQLDCAIYVDTGFSYPETRALVNYAASLLPILHVVQSDRQGQHEQMGIPADVVPIDWTEVGQQITSPKPIRIQSYLGCCFANITLPLWAKAKELGVTTLVMGQRNDEGYRSPARDGTPCEGITRLHPIEGWTAQHVLDYLETQMDVPAHYRFSAQTSLDCYDCTGYEREAHERVAWMKATHPQAYAAYAMKHHALYTALQEALQLALPDAARVPPLRAEVNR